MTITKSFIPLVDEKTYTIDTQKKLKITMKHHRFARRPWRSEDMIIPELRNVFPK